MDIVSKFIEGFLKKRQLMALMGGIYGFVGGFGLTVLSYGVWIAKYSGSYYIYRDFIQSSPLWWIFSAPNIVTVHVLEMLVKSFGRQEYYTSESTLFSMLFANALLWGIFAYAASSVLADKKLFRLSRSQTVAIFTLAVVEAYILVPSECCGLHYLLGPPISSSSWIDSASDGGQPRLLTRTDVNPLYVIPIVILLAAAAVVLSPDRFKFDVGRILPLSAAITFFVVLSFMVNAGIFCICGGSATHTGFAKIKPQLAGLGVTNEGAVKAVFTNGAGARISVKEVRIIDSNQRSGRSCVGNVTSLDGGGGYGGNGPGGIDVGENFMVEAGAGCMTPGRVGDIYNLGVVITYWYDRPGKDNNVHTDQGIIRGPME